MAATIQISDIEARQLGWIHSNKFTVPELFWKKFYPDKSFQYACRVLKGYSNPDKDLLHVQKPHRFLNSYYFLTGGAIRYLDGQNRVLVRSTRYPVKINPYEREHDLMVQKVRIAFEGSGDLKEVFWVSDFEMRSGITPATKARFLEGGFNKEKWKSNWSEWRYKSRRTPDGYFEAVVDGKRYGFALEVENTPRSEWKIHAMVDYLEDSFPEATKLVVSANRHNAIRMYEALQAKVRKSEHPKWFISYMERALTLPFKKIFHSLTRPIQAAPAEQAPPDSN